MKQLLSELTKPPKITIALSRWKGINFFFFNLYVSSLSTSKLGKMEMGCDNGNVAFPSTKQSLPEILLNQKSNSTFFFFFFFLNPWNLTTSSKIRSKSPNLPFKVKLEQFHTTAKSIKQSFCIHKRYWEKPINKTPLFPTIHQTASVHSTEIKVSQKYLHTKSRIIKDRVFSLRREQNQENPTNKKYVFYYLKMRLYFTGYLAQSQKPRNKNPIFDRYLQRLNRRRRRKAYQNEEI